MRRTATTPRRSAALAAASPLCPARISAAIAFRSGSSASASISPLSCVENRKKKVIRPTSSSPMVAASPSARRTSTRRSSRPRSAAKDIADAPDRAEHAHRLRALQLSAQAIHVHVDHVGARVELVAPDQPQDLLAREHLALARHQAGEQLELPGGQVERALSAASQPAQRIHLDDTGA